MKDPIKIIHKMKNNNRRVQYKVYVYIGPLVPNKIMKILESISEKDLYVTFNTLSKDEYAQLETMYGEFWYEKFFISHHIYKQRSDINNTVMKKKNLMTKFGKEWYGKHITEAPLKKLSYSFASNYYNMLLFRNKIKTQTRKVEIDFRTNIETNIINPVLEEQEGGDDTNEDTDADEDEDDNDEGGEEEVKLVNEEDYQEQIEEDFNLDEITKLYATTDVENNKTIKETSKLISEAINDKKWEKETQNLEKKYDDSLDSITYDIKIEDVYIKYYVTEQYIFKDDTIKSMRQKIATSLPISNKFGKSIRVLPEAQYFWSEYIYENKLDLVMLGQKWIRKNELLKIDIKPNENLKIYEKLRNNLGYLKESFGYKIKREDDETNIIRSYDEFMTMNEIYMLDVYNELGIGYSPEPEEKRNMYDVYINIYFPMISYERLEQIIQLLTGKNNKEVQYIESVIGTICNDVKLETQIEETVEQAKLDLGKFDKMFEKNHIIQSIIHVNLNNPKNLTGTTSDTKFNLYRIFDNFIVSDDYPFIQYQSADSQLTYKFFNEFQDMNEVSGNQDLLAKWFENAPYGISFKIKVKDNTKAIGDKYISINLHEPGRIEYKITWKEMDEATVEDINASYEYVRELLKKINSENKKIKFMMPPDDRFKYAFINTIQKFSIPENFKINHNDLSEFSRFFFPYISLVIEPKKRKSKKQDVAEETSKYGTYLRYKRISKYENRTKMHLRILYFLRNYELNDRELIDEIAKQFNITTEDSARELDYVRDKYSKVIKKSKKLLKKLKTLPKSKPPGIGIDIQGRDKDNYKIRITGSRNKEQLEEIVDFMKVLIYLYVETYLYKKKEYQKLKDQLKNLNKIARRRNKVMEIVEYDASVQTVKTITNLDKARLGFKPEKGQSQWTRSCQNSGTDKKRRPEITPGNQIDKLLKEGYKFNKETGFYEKKVDMKVKGKVYSTMIKAIKLSGDDNTFNFYTCDPSEKNIHKYIGFLARGNNPSDLCMPCCFKKDQLKSNNKEKKNYFLKCMGENNVKDDKTASITKNLGDKLYILQETNKVQEGRFIYLPKYLDIFFNTLWEHDNKIKNHYLLESKSGYFFKYTVKHDHYHLLVALSNIYDKPIPELIDSMVRFLEKDKDNVYFTYLNSGDISETFKTRAKYIEYMKSSNYLEYDIIGELSSIPGVLSPKGINYYILNKHTVTIKRNLEKEEIKERYYLDCMNPENKYQLDEDRDIVILIKEDKYYFPIYRVQKNDAVDKKINLTKFYSNSGYFEKILKELRNYHTKSCNNNIISNSLYAKNIIRLLNETSSGVIKKQYIDDRHKCKYLELDNGLIIPTSPSGIHYKYPFDMNPQNITKDLPKLKDAIKLLNNIESKLKLEYIPNTIFYDNKKQQGSRNSIHIISILLNNNLIIPINNEMVDEDSIKTLALPIRFQPLEETIDIEIINWSKNGKPIIYDNRLQSVREHNYLNESYNLFRLELSLYLSNNDDLKDKVIQIVKNQKMNTKDKKHELRKILFQILDSKLATEYKISQKGGGEKVAFITKELPSLKEYVISNVRDYCMINKTKDKCSSNIHCMWKDDTCKLQIYQNVAVEFVNRIIEEMVQDGIKFKELIQEGSYYVSDIVDYTQYTNRTNQQIIKATNFNISKLMGEMFGKDKIPTIGKRQMMRMHMNDNVEEEDIGTQLVEMGKQYIQKITPNKDSIIRGYVNSYYWMNNPLYDIESRNLGFYNDLQTNITYLFKANIIDWVQNNVTKGNDKVRKYLQKYFKDTDNFFESTLNKFRKSSFNTDGKIELYILSHIIPNPIVVYDNFSNVKYIFLQGEVEVNDETIKNFTNEKNINKTIFLKFDYDNSTTIPKNIYSIYYI